MKGFWCLWINVVMLTSALSPARRKVPPDMFDALQAHFGERCSLALSVREQHGQDESVFNIPPPEAVVFAESPEDVVFTVALAARHKIPVIPYGAGSSLEGHLLALEGGICLNVSRMNRILSVNADDLTVTVQPGVTREALNEALRHEGLFFPIDPGANATIGGMTSTRASGTNAVRYGSMRENVLKLKVVTASGDIIQTGTRAKKSSAGYDLTRLFVGAEGTLGIITEITLRLYPLPEAISAAICSFPSIEAAVRTTIAAIQMGIPISRCEFMDVNAVKAVNRAEHMSLALSPLLLMEFTGSPTGVREQAESMAEIASENGGQNFSWAEQPEDRSRLWKARHRAYLSGLQLRPGCKAITTDVCVPISRLADCVLEAIAEVDATGLPYFAVGHVGDGNFHMCYLVNPNDPQNVALGETLSRHVVERAIRMEGTCTGEHGIGLHKQNFLVEETGAGAVAAMRAVKHALDPDNIMNPGKVFVW